ncbi:MAG: FtsX-like permease family protein [Pseudomonadota bacterium]
MSLAIAGRIAARELRGGLAGFRIFIACLALGVAAIAAVGSVRMAIQEGLDREGAAILGGDASMRFTYRFADEAERAWMEENAASVSEIVDFRSMAVIEGQRALTQVKGVDAVYPIYGEAILDPAMPLDEALSVQGGVPGGVMDPVLIARLGMEPGDRFRLGTQEFELRAALIREPDAGGAGFSLGPRTLVQLDALAESGLITPGTLFESNYRLQFAGNPDLTALEAEAEALFRDSGLRWRDSRNGAPGVARFVDRIGSFLVLVGLAGLAVGGVGVAAAVRTYLDKKTEVIATLKTLGADGQTIFLVYLMQVGLITLVGIALGLLLGAGLPALFAPIIEAGLPVPAVFGVYATPLAEAAHYGMLTALIFTIWPLAQARDIRAARLFREVATRGRSLPRPAYLLAVALLAVALISAAAYFSGIPTLALWSAGGIVGALALLALSAMAARWMTGRAARQRWARGRTSVRLALGAVGGPGSEAMPVVLSLGLGLTVLAAVGQIDTNMRNAIAQDLPDIAPAYFMVDIQNGQLPEFLDRANAQEGVDQIDTAPMLRGIITRINGAPAREVAGDHWTLNGDRGVTYSNVPPEGAIITEGDWWDESYDGPPIVSFADEEARELGLTLGDKITVNILGRDIEAEIVNFRVVDFSNMGINFIMSMNPGALAGAPHTHIATLYAQEQAEAPLLRDLSQAFPNITAIRVRDAIDRVSEALAGLAAATSYGAAATLVTGFVVLIGAAAAGESRRVFESAVLKTIGATRGSILSSFALRSAILGAAAGIVAIFAGALAGWGVMTYVMDTDYTFEPVSAIGIVLGGALASLLAGLLFAMRPLSVRPAQVLRARD